MKLDNFVEEEVEVFESDDDGLSLESFQNTSTFNMDLNVDMISSYFSKNKFIINPDFQRRKVWDDTRRSKFIESLILNLPIPSILLAEDKSKNKYIIIDGKQRITTILDFMAPGKDGNGFKLKNLEILDELNGYTYKKLLEDEDKISYLSQFESYPIKTSIVRNYDEKLLYFIFARLNSGSVPLSTQELRHTLFPGEFSKFINVKSADNLNIKKILKIKTDKVDERMKDAELLCRYYSFKYFLNDYEDTVGQLLDYTYEKINKNWDDYKAKVEYDLDEFDAAVKFVYDIFKEDAFKIYSIESEKFNKFNRLVYDILTVNFSNESNRKKVVGRESDFINFFKGLFADSTFNDAFKPTTSSKDKTLNRFRIFTEKFEKEF